MKHYLNLHFSSVLLWLLSVYEWAKRNHSSKQLACFIARTQRQTFCVKALCFCCFYIFLWHWHMVIVVCRFYCHWNICRAKVEVDKLGMFSDQCWCQVLEISAENGQSCWFLCFVLVQYIISYKLNKKDLLVRYSSQFCSLEGVA